jgi:hypothetical protein
MQSASCRVRQGGSSQDVDLNFSEDRSSEVNLQNGILKGMLKTANFKGVFSIFSSGSPLLLQRLFTQKGLFYLLTWYKNLKIIKIMLPPL